MGSSKAQTIGYHYLFSILFGFGRGPWNELKAIKVGDQLAWEGNLCGTGVQAISKPDLFGGEKKEGGIQGPFRIFYGAHNQILPGAGSAVVGGKGPYSGSRSLPAVKTTIGGLMSEFRGVTTLWYDGLISSMNPYPKEWKFRGRRYSAGWHGDICWYPIKSAIFLADGKVHAMNPAHVIYQCLTDPSWGRGYARSELDDNSFIFSANTFADEMMGLCLKWTRTDDIDTFIKLVCDHAGAVCYQSRETGLWKLRPIRADYVVADLPLFTPSTGLLDITEDDSSSQDTAINEVICTGRDPITDEDIQVRAHNLAARYSQGASNTEDKAYPGFPTKELLARAAQRDLKIHAAGLKKFNVKLDRAGYQIEPGMPFRISDPRRGIAEIVLRAGEITEGATGDGSVTIRAMQDVYGMPATSFVTPVDSSWQGPATEAAPALAESLIEASYRDVLIRTSQANINVLTDSDAFVGALAAAPNSTTYEYDLATRVNGEPAYVIGPTGGFTGTATLTAPITATQTVLMLSGVTGFAADLVGQAVLLGTTEMVALEAYNDVTNEIAVKRGVADTIPRAHLAGTRIWTIDDDLVTDPREYVSGEIVEGKVLSRTSNDVMLEAEAATLTTTLVGRFGRPYPPGNYLVDGELAITLSGGERPEPVLTWAHRDRKLQADQLVGHLEASVGPEAGTTYTIRVYAIDGVTLLNTYDAGAADTWTYTAAMQAVDGGPTVVYIELEATRDGLASWQKYRNVIVLNGGYGMGYGLNYGGNVA